MRALITGSDGFVGNAFCRELYSQGWDVTGIDTNSGVDCRDFFRILGLPHYDLVVHLAANVGGRVAIDKEPLFVAENLALDVAFFRWAVEARPGRAVYFSSSAAYGKVLQAEGVFEVLSEDMIDFSRDGILAPDATYGWAKLTGELLAEHARGAGARLSVVRPFSGYGAEQSVDYPFGAFLQRALSRATPFEVWGSGAQQRDWIHVDDVVAATLAIAQAGLDGPLNLCTGVPTTMDHLAELFMKAAGYEAPIFHREQAPSGVHHRVGDATRLHEVYVPKINLVDGIAAAVARGRGATP